MIKQTTPTVTPEIPSTVSINGEEYSLEDAQKYIEKGRHTLDLEKEWNTPVDNVWPEYGKTREELKATAAERDAAKAEIESFKSKQNAGVETPADVQAARKAAKDLGLTLNDELDQRGYLKREDLDKLLPELFSRHDVEQEAIKKVLDEGSALEKEIDGSDGRPAFNRKIALAYANAYNIPDLKQAYEEMNKPQLDAWKTRQVDAEKARGLKTLTGGGLKSAKESKVTEDNVQALLHEQLYGGE